MPQQQQQLELEQSHFHTYDTVRTPAAAQDSSTIPVRKINSVGPGAADHSYRSQRRAAPSPLQQSSSQTAITSPPGSATPTRTTFSVPFASQSFGVADSLPGQSRFQKDSLEDLTGTQKSFYQSEDSSTENLPALINNKVDRSRTISNAASRSVSEPVLNQNFQGRPVVSIPTATTIPPHPASMGRAPPRQSSIDSAISSMSDGGNQKGQGGGSENTSQDIASLIKAAGSAEALIQYLLKEKQSQTAQNTQLWRLVDKQRAMILGLNKDLERSLKDKEKYRKKLKESLNAVTQISPSESTQGEPSSDAGSVSSIQNKPLDSPKLSNMEVLISAGLREPEDENPASPIEVAIAPYPITPPGIQIDKISTPRLNNMFEAEHRMPSPTAHAFQQYDPDALQTGSEGTKLQRSPSMTHEVPYKSALPPSRTFTDNPPPKGPPSTLPPGLPMSPMARRNVSSPVTMAAPASAQISSPRSPPLRKAPPAPLDLGPKTDTSSHLHAANGGEETDSDYDDVLEVDEIPVMTDRGRRKTREEDDRERGTAAEKDAEQSSLSEKTSSSGKGAPDSRPTTPKKSDSTLISPRTVPIPLSPPLNNAGLNTTNSLVGMLTADIASYGGLSSPLASPGLPSSPRPMDRSMGFLTPRNPRDTTSTDSTVNSPPISPRGMGALPVAAPLSPRAPRQPIPLPPGTPMSIMSPLESKAEPLQLNSPRPLILSKKVTSAVSTSPVEQSPTSPSLPTAIGVSKELVTEEYPDLLLPPNALPSVMVKVASSRLKPSRSSIMFPKNYDEDPVFTLAVLSRSDGQELWRVEKDSSSLSQLDAYLKQSSAITAKAPDRSLFTGHSPAKLDARRVALDQYLDEVLNTPMDLSCALELCLYLSTNAMEPNAEVLNMIGDSAMDSPVKTGPGGRTYKNGYLTKRGKNFGGWKARFFVLDGPVFRYFESPGGPHLGTIKLQNAQIGKQQQSAENQSPSRPESEDPDNQYRHAFLILEPKRKDSSSLVRHVLCAESDQERDEWVDALLQWVDFRDDDEFPLRISSRQHTHTNSAEPGSRANGASSKKKAYNSSRPQTAPEQEDLRGISYDSTKQGNAPRRVKKAGTPSPPAQGQENEPMNKAMPVQSSKAISAPKNAQIIQDSTSWGNKSNMLNPISADERTKQKKRSFFGFGSKPRGSDDTPELIAIDSSTNLTQMAIDQHGPIRQVFGAPISEAVKYNHPVNVRIELPAVVYRCIEYLGAQNAINEEGIFRLSGSNVVIKQLRERYNVEGDVSLVTDKQYYDIHAVASLLKLYFRELPSTILTRELHMEFLAVTELSSVGEKVEALHGLVLRLPRANMSVLRYLIAFLNTIINNSDVNKMTVRNVGIVFSPTLNIPAPVFALFLQQYDGVFGAESEASSPTEAPITAPSRPPPRPKYQESTPSYEQQYRPPPNFPQPQHYNPQRPAYETGFVGGQPPYEPQLMAGPEYGSRAPTLAGPAYDSFNAGYRQKQSSSPGPMSKSRRRESTMFGMGMALNKKPSSQRMHDERVGEESLYD